MTDSMLGLCQRIRSFYAVVFAVAPNRSQTYYNCFSICQISIGNVTNVLDLTGEKSRLNGGIIYLCSIVESKYIHIRMHTHTTFSPSLSLLQTDKIKTTYSDIFPDTRLVQIVRFCQNYQLQVTEYTLFITKHSEKSA